MAWYPPTPPSSGQDAYYEYPPPGAAYAPPLLAAPPGAGTGGWAGAAPQATPLPLRAAIKQLLRQYWRILTKPGAATFAGEMGKAEWGIIWVQLFGYAVITTILFALAWIILTLFLNFLFTSLTPASGAGSFNLVPFLLLPGIFYTVFVFVGVIGGFFFGQGITFLLAKAFGGQGDFTAQAYTALLYLIPIGLVSGLIALVPYVGGLVAQAGTVYGLVLQVFSLMAVHRLSGGKATAVALIPVAVGIVLGVAAYLILLLIFLNSFSAPFHTMPTLPTP